MSKKTIRIFLAIIAILIGIIAGIIAGWLTIACGKVPASAVLAGGAAFAGATSFMVMVFKYVDTPEPDPAGPEQSPAGRNPVP
ncbi:hypothetical protein [Nocardia sp. NPDC051832]|uniref:hypothetical protein n=1 Tax=Nocardia sp. NPDC051832 TaxID=3155673 RepID=UPI003430585B